MIFELHVEDVRTRGNQIKIEGNEYKLSDRDTHKSEIVDELTIVECNDLEDMVFRLELTYSKIEYLLNVKYIDGSSTKYTLEPGRYEFSDTNLMLNSFFPVDSE